MKKKIYLILTLILALFVYMPFVYADRGDLRYQITNFSVDDASRNITFEGWAFIHQTNNYRTVYKLVDGKDSGDNREIIKQGGGQQFRITAYDSHNNLIESKIVDGDSNPNYNFTLRMFFMYPNYTFIKDYNNESGNGDMNCNGSINSNCYYKDLHFKISFKIDENWYGKNIHFTVAAYNNDYGKWSEDDLYILNNGHGGPRINSNSSIVEVRNENTFNKVIFLAEKAVVKDDIVNWKSKFSPNAWYAEPGDIFLVDKYEEGGTGTSGIGGTADVGKYYIYSSTPSNINQAKPCSKWPRYNCYYGSETKTNTVIGAWASWVVPYGSTSFRIKIKNDKKCPADNGNNIKLSCNNTTNMVSECKELTVYEGNASAIFSIKQTGTFAVLLSPTEIYNGGGIKFGLLYYNIIHFEKVSGSTSVNISKVIENRVIKPDNIDLTDIKVGGIDVVKTNVQRYCYQTGPDSNNDVKTVCVFYFKPQMVNQNGTVSSGGTDLGINNKYYLPLDSDSKTIYRVSAKLKNASLLNEGTAKTDSFENSAWYGTKWNEISLSDDGTCDVNVYKLGPGKYIKYDKNIEYDSENNFNVVYNYIYRPIDLNNPFPGINRFPGLNWASWYGIEANRERLKESYEHLNYSIELNSNSIYNIKKYNKTNDYFSFDLQKFISETGLSVGGSE